MSEDMHEVTIAQVEIDVLTRLQEGLRHASFSDDTTVPEAIDFLIRSFESMKTLARLRDAEAEAGATQRKLVQ